MNDEMNPQGLLKAAARLVERALGKLDMTAHDCPHCDRHLFLNLDHARIFEQFSELPAKLRNAATQLDGAVLVDGHARQTSKGFYPAASEARRRTRQDALAGTVVVDPRD